MKLTELTQSGINMFTVAQPTDEELIKYFDEHQEQAENFKEDIEEMKEEKFYKMEDIKKEDKVTMMDETDIEFLNEARKYGYTNFETLVPRNSVEYEMMLNMMQNMRTYLRKNMGDIAKFMKEPIVAPKFKFNYRPKFSDYLKLAAYDYRDQQWENYLRLIVINEEENYFCAKYYDEVGRKYTKFSDKFLN